MRYAILTAVSTLAQTEGESLHEQELKSRSVASSKGWTPTGLVYRIEGQSRTRWINLRDAERAIPPLAAALNDAQVLAPQRDAAAAKAAQAASRQDAAAARIRAKLGLTDKEWADLKEALR